MKNIKEEQIINSEKKKQVLVLAIGIALLPPLWAVLAPYIGITTGAVALICASLYKCGDGSKIMLGFWCGDLWAVLAILIMQSLNFNENVELFLTLCVLGFIAVIVASLLEKIIFLPSWLCGWAIGLTIMGPAKIGEVLSLAFQIAVAMAVGVWYVGAGVDLFTRCILKNKKGE